MSYWAREILAEAPPDEALEQLVDRVLQLEADRCGEILDGCAARHSGHIQELLGGMARVVRAHLGGAR